MSIDKILVVDDEAIVRDFLAETLRRKQIEVVTAESGNKAVSLLKDNVFDMVITDMKMPGLTGIDVLRKVKEASPQTLVIVITAFGSIENAVEAMRLGAFNYLIKPFSPDTIEALIEKASEHASLVEENHYLRQEVSKSTTGPLIIYESPLMKQVLSDVEKVAKSNANVFITGESGTGKEVIAHAIHFQSLRSNHPFIKVNCAAIPETLIESEFFGHEKGAFTGAAAKRSGRFELAHEGTLLLDEVTEIPIGIQSKLLRVVQEQEFERVGGSKPIKVSVRLISTSNRTINEAISNKILREDLYYRLNVIPIHLPPLRDRREDIIPITEYLLKKLCAENHKELKVLDKASKEKLLAYSWPGNVRELGNIIERAVVLETDKAIKPERLTIDAMSGTASAQGLPLGMSLQELEKRFIIETLKAQHNNPAKTAEVLQISSKDLKNRMEKYGCNTQGQC